MLSSLLHKNLVLFEYFYRHSPCVISEDGGSVSFNRHCWI